MSRQTENMAGTTVTKLIRKSFRDMQHEELRVTECEMGLGKFSWHRVARMLHIHPLRLGSTCLGWTQSIRTATCVPESSEYFLFCGQVTLPVFVGDFPSVNPRGPPDAESHHRYGAVT